MSRYPFFLALIVLTLSTSVLILRPNSAVPACQSTRDFGEWVYLMKPDTIMRAIRVSEGVPSYGLLWLAEKYDGHNRVPVSIGRKHGGQLLHRIYRRWVQAGRPRPFLEYLRDTWAPLGVNNDPKGLNHHWLENVRLNLGMQFGVSD